MKVNFKRLGILALILTLFVSLAGCSFGKQAAQNDATKSAAQKQKEAEKQKEAAKITTDTEKTAQLKNEKAIFNGQVYVQNNRAIATMIIKSGVSDKEAKDLAQKYAQDLKKKYKNMPVTVMAVRDNKNIVNLTVK